MYIYIVYTCKYLYNMNLHLLYENRRHTYMETFEMQHVWRLKSVVHCHCMMLYVMLYVMFETQDVWSHALKPCFVVTQAPVVVSLPPGVLPDAPKPAFDTDDPGPAVPVPWKFVVSITQGQTARTENSKIRVRREKTKIRKTAKKHQTGERKRCNAVTGKEKNNFLRLLICRI